MLYGLTQYWPTRIFFTVTGTSCQKLLFWHHIGQGNWNLGNIPSSCWQSCNWRRKWLTGHFYLASGKWKLIPTSLAGRSSLPVSGMRHQSATTARSLHLAGMKTLQLGFIPIQLFGPKFHSPCSSFTAELGGCDKRAPCVERGPEFAAVSPLPVNLQTAHLPLSTLAQLVHTCRTDIQVCACNPHILSTYWLTLAFANF